MRSCVLVVLMLACLAPGALAAAPPNAVNGVCTRWLYPPRGSASFWFLTTE